MWPSYPLPFRFFWFHWLANICNLKWIWVLFGWPEISLAAGQSVWAWHLKGPDHDWTPGHPASTYSGQEQQVFGCVSFFFFLLGVLVGNSVIYRQFPKRGHGAEGAEQILTLGFVCSGASRNTDLLMSQQETWPIRISETESSCSCYCGCPIPNPNPISFCGFSFFPDSTAHLLQHFN